MAASTPSRRRDRAEIGRARPSPPMPTRSTTSPLIASARRRDVGGKSRRDRARRRRRSRPRLWRRALRPAIVAPSARRKSAASAAGIDKFFGIEAGQRIAVNGNAVRRGDAERGDGRRETRRRAALNPRIWMLPRDVISMTPLPCCAPPRTGRRMRRAESCRSAAAAPAIRRRSASAPTVPDRRRGVAEAGCA